MALTLRDLKAAGLPRRWMRYEPLRVIFWALAKPYFRALLQHQPIQHQPEHEVAIRALSNRLALLEELIAQTTRADLPEGDHRSSEEYERRVVSGLP